MTGDMIEVCSKCGKMPRGIDLTAEGLFRCGRCGNNSLTTVTNSDYEKIVTELDQRYHAEILNVRMTDVKETHLIELKKTTVKKAPKKPIKNKSKKIKK